MKWTGLLSASMIALLALPGIARAAADEEPDPNNPYARFDPDGVPLAVTQTGKHAPTPSQIEAMRKQAIEDARAKNWLMLEYQNQVKAHSRNAQGKEQPQNLYLQLGMDRSLAKLAGVDGSDSNTGLSVQPLHATPSPATTSPTLRPEAPTGAFTPLLSPLSTLNSGTKPFVISPFSSSVPSILAPDIGGSGNNQQRYAPPPPSPPHSSSYTEVIDMQTPGMIAAKDNSLGTPDLNLDSLPGDALPGETPDQARAREENASHLAVPMDADRLHQVNTEKLKVPAVTLTKNTPASQQQQQAQDNTPKAIPVNPADAPVPVMQQQQISPVHPAIGNPFDILNR